MKSLLVWMILSSFVGTIPSAYAETDSTVDFQNPFSSQSDYRKGQVFLSTDYDPALYHLGADYCVEASEERGELEGTPIRPIAAGRVIQRRFSVPAQREDGVGNYVIIRHDDGTEAVYMHLAKVKFDEGQRVKENMIIGEAGDIILHSPPENCPHLHLEIRRSTSAALNVLPNLRYGYVSRNGVDRLVRPLNTEGSVLSWVERHFIDPDEFITTDGAAQVSKTNQRNSSKAVTNQETSDAPDDNASKKEQASNPAAAASQGSTSDPYMSNGEAKALIESTWNDNAVVLPMNGDFTVGWQGASWDGDTIRKELIEKIGALNKVGLVAIEVDAEYEQFRKGSWSKGGWSAWIQLTQRGVLKKFSIQPTSEGKKYAHPDRPKLLRLPMGSFDVHTIVRNEKRPKEVDVYQLLMVRYMANWDPLYKEYTKQRGRQLSRQRKAIVLFKWNPFTEEWEFVTNDIANATEEFRSNNVANVLRSAE